MRHIKNLFVGSVIFIGLTSLSGNFAKDVYLCMGPNSYAYHYVSDCRGLSKCTTQLEKTSEEKAIAAGRKLCGWED